MGFDTLIDADVRVTWGVVMLPPDALSQIHAELEGIKETAADLHRSLERDYRSQVPAVQDAVQGGATIGGPMVGLGWVDLRNVYSRCIEESVQLVFNIDQGSQALLDAADIIAKKYGASDGFARATTDDVSSVLVVLPPPPADQPAVEGPVKPV